MPSNTNSGSDESRIIQPRQGIWRTYDGTDGLPAGTWCLLQDRQGYLWLGTGKGLCRYDGVRFLTYTTEDGLPANFIRSICEDSQGQLWFGTVGGVSCYDGERFVSYTTEDGLVGDNVISIFEDLQGRLWFGTQESGVSCYDGKEFTNYTTENGLVSNRIHSAYEDSQGRLWFGAVDGVSCREGEKFTNYTTKDGLAQNNVRAIREDSQGRMWFGTYRGGISCYDGEQFINYTTKDGLAYNSVQAIYEDSQRHLWFGTHGGGICCFDGRGFTTYTTADGLQDNRVLDMLQDREGSFWFAHQHGGLTRFDPETIRLLTLTTVSEALIQTGEGTLWFGDANHLCCLHKGEQRRKTFGSDVCCLMEDSKGRFWVGTLRDGLYCYDSTHSVWEDKPRRFTTEDGLNSNTIWYVMEARDGTIWVGTSDSPGCLCRFDGDRFEAIQTSHPVVQRLLEDSRGRIWMGGWGGGGLSYYTPLGSPSASMSGRRLRGKRKKKDSEGEGYAVSLHNYTTTHGLPSNVVISIVEDDANRLWVGTEDGLCCFDGNQFILYGEEISDHGEFHQCAARDVNGQLWFGTQGHGVYRYDGKHFQRFSKSDGLPSNGVTAFVPQQDGSMIVGTLRGVVHYRPTAIVPPKIEIREVVADQVYSHPEALELTTTGADLVTIAYHGLSLSTHRMRYSYILEGHDREWRDTWESQVRYEKLPVGEYTFRVIAINRDLVCSEAPATLQLTVVPDPRNEHIARLESELEERERAEMERIYRELEDARQIQQSLLPKEPPQMESFEMAGTSIPAREVSGDFYNYLPLGHNVGVVVADVTGKSVKAAMVAAMTSGMLNTAVEVQQDLWNSPGTILGDLNTRLKPHLVRGMYTAMSLGVLHAGDNRLAFSNSGMPYPIVKRGDEVWELELNGLPLGLMDGVEYDESSADLKAGDFVVFYSDGLIEAVNEAEEMYQTERLLEVLRQSKPHLSAQEMMDLIIGDVHAFVGNVESYDDITIVVVRVI